MLEPGKVRAEYHTKVFVSVFGLNWTTIQVVQVTIILTDRVSTETDKTGLGFMK